MLTLMYSCSLILVTVWLLYSMCDLDMIIKRTVMQMSTYPLQIVQENAWHKLQGAETSMQVPMRWVVLCSHMYTLVGSKHLNTLIEHHLQRAWRWYQVMQEMIPLQRTPVLQVCICAFYTTGLTTNYCATANWESYSTESVLLSNRTNIS